MSEEAASYNAGNQSVLARLENLQTVLSEESVELDQAIQQVCSDLYIQKDPTKSVAEVRRQVQGMQKRLKSLDGMLSAVEEQQERRHLLTPEEQERYDHMERIKYLASLSKEELAQEDVDQYELVEIEMYLRDIGVDV